MSAWRLIVLIVIFVSEFVSTDEDFLRFNCKIIEDSTPLYKLKRHLFCDYDPGIRPGHGGKNSTVIEATLLPKFVKFETWSARMKINSWLFLEWNDPLLTWDPKAHDDIETISIRRSEIWIPELYAMNPNRGDMARIPNTKCKLSHEGQVRCVPPIQYSAPCISDYTHWPWDVHNCSLQLGAWAYYDEEITFNENTGIIIDHYRKTEEWKISLPRMSLTRKKSKLSSNATFPIFTVSVLLTRTHTALQSAFVSPAIILTVVTLTILWLRPGSTERLILSCFNLLGHMVAIRHLHYRIPYTGNVPNIMIFYHNSLILSSLVLILCCWLQKILKWKLEVPVWLASQVSMVLTSKVGQVLSINMVDPKGSTLLQADANDNTGLVNAEPNRAKWENVVIVIGWLLLFILTFIYFIMCLILLC